MKRAAVKWGPLDELCRAFGGEDDSTACWIEDLDGQLVAGKQSNGSVGGSTPIESAGETIATLHTGGEVATARRESLAGLCRQEIEHQRTLRDMAGATARLWRQTNAMLRMAASTQLTLDPESTVAGVIAALKKSTCFARSAAVLRLPGDDEYSRMGDSTPARMATGILEPLAPIEGEVVLTTDIELDATAVARCRKVAEFPEEAAVVALATEAERYGYLFAAFPSDTPPSSEDCKLLAACAQILSVGIANGHTLRRAKEATRQQVESKLYETLAKTVPVGIFRVDASGREVAYVNQQWRRITALGGQESIAEAWVAGMHDEDREEVLSAWRATAERGDPFRVQYRLVRSDEELRWVLAQAAAEYDNAGNIVGFVGSLTDVTEQKRAEAEKERLESQLRESQKMESLGVLAGGIAHDFNNILGAIIGSAELAIGKVDEESRVHRNLTRILTGANRAKDLVRQILAFSRHDEVERNSTDLAQVAEEALTLARASIPATIDLARDIETDCPPVLADSTQIHQILMNLCTNAYHAIGKGGGTITVALRHVTLEAGTDLPAGDYLRLSVSDTGCGMDEETKSRIFDPFFTTKGVNEGTGLGLSVVHGIVKKHGGTITVESELGEGTSFHIYLPVANDAPAALAGAEEAAPGGSGRVMLVDDETELLATASEMLEELGYQVTAFSSSVAALEAFRATPGDFDVVVSDQTMPDMTGSDMYRQMAALRSDVRFVVATGFSDTLSPSGARKMGLAGFIPKPYRARDLAKTVARVLEQAPPAA